MFIDVRKFEEKRSQRDSQFEDTRDIKRGYITRIEADGSVEGDRSGLVWFQARDPNSQPFQVFYDGVIGDLRANMNCLVERDPKEPGRWTIKKFYTSAYFDDQSVYEQLPSSSMIPRKEDYEWPPGYPGAKALNIFPRAITDFAVRPTSPASMKARVYSGIYPGATNYARFQGPVNTKDFTSDVPGAGLARLAAISIDNTGTLNYTNGTTFVDGLPMPEAALPVVPASQMLISAIRLVNGMTVIEEGNFDLEMRPLMAQGVVNTKVSEVWESDFDAVALQADADGGIGIGTATVPHGGVGTAQLAIEGGITGFTTPAVQITTTADDYPLYQIWPFSHDEIWLLFDSYAEGYGLNPPALFNSSDIGSNFALVKRADTVSLKYNTGASQGSNIGGFSAGLPVGWDSTFTADVSGNLGVGTETPRSTIDVLDTAAEQLRLTFEDNTKFTKFLVDTNHDLTITPSSTGQVIFQPTTDSTDFLQILDADGGVPIFNVDSVAEAVGIGTATPVARLEIEDAAIASGFLVKITADDQVPIGLAIGNDTYDTDDLESLALWVDNVGVGHIRMGVVNNPLALQVTGGNVGIGTVGPDARLDVLALTEQLRLTYADGSKFVSFTLDTNHDLTITPSSTGQVIFQPTTDSTDFLQILDADGGVPIFNVDSVAEAVGIGTATPSVLLDVTFTPAGSGINTPLYLQPNANFAVDEATIILFSGKNNTDKKAGFGYITQEATYFRGDLVFLLEGTADHSIVTLADEKMRITYGGDVGIGTTSPDSQLVVNTNVFIGPPAASGNTSNSNMTYGLTINQEDADNELVSFMSSDVAHGVTSIAETDVFGHIRKLSPSSGGLWFRGLSEATTGFEALSIGASDITTKSTSSSGYIHLVAYKKSGTSVTDTGANANCVVMKNATTTLWILDSEGDIFYGGTDDGTITDEYDDIELLTGFRAVMSPSDSPAHQRFKGFLKETENILVQQGVLTAPLNDGGLVSDTGIKGLLIDAIYQLNEKIAGLERQLNAI